MRWNRGAILLLACGACSGPDDEPTPDPGITVIAGGGLVDTAATTFVQALVVEVVSPQGLAEGVVVRFEATAAAGVPTVLVAPLVGMSVFGPSTAIATDSRGRASARIQLGTVAGAAELQVTVPELGYSTTVQYTVEPALPFTLTAAPQDTVVEVGGSFTSRSTVVDRFGNAVDEAVTLTEPSTNLTVAGNLITAVAPGRGTVTARAGALADVLRVFVGPLSTISGLTPTELVQFATDGSVSSHSPLGRGGGPLTADWSVNGQLLVADELEGGPLRIIFPNGEALTIPTAGDAWPLHPEFSPDGQWIYYARSDLGWHIRRVRVDGGGDQPVGNVPVNHAAPSLSPDGTLMAMVNLVPDRIEIFEFSTNTIREIAAAAHSPAWSPDGDLIAFVNTTSGQIEVISPSGSGRRVISPEGMRFQVGIDWTQDGLFVVAYEVDSQMILAIDPQSGATIEYRYPGIGAPAARPR